MDKQQAVLLARQELARRELARRHARDTDMQQNHPWAYKAAEYLQGHPRAKSMFEAVQKPLERTAGAIYPLGLGVGQEAGDIAASVLNTPAALAGLVTGERPYNVPHPEFRKKLDGSTYDDMAFQVGKMAMGIPALIGGEALASRGLGKLAELGGASRASTLYPSLGRRMATGAATGATIGEGEDMRGRGLSALIGGALPLASELPLTKARATRAYPKAEAVLESRGVEGFKIPPKYKKELMSLKNMKDLKPIREDIQILMDKAKSGRYEDLHTLQSQLRSAADSIKFNNPLLSKKLYDTREGILRGMRQHAIDSGAPEAAAHTVRDRDWET